MSSAAAPVPAPAAAPAPPAGRREKKSSSSSRSFPDSFKTGKPSGGHSAGAAKAAAAAAAAAEAPSAAAAAAAASSSSAHGHRSFPFKATLLKAPLTLEVLLTLFVPVENVGLALQAVDRSNKQGGLRVNVFTPVSVCKARREHGHGRRHPS
jgi:hypothetical protein